MSQYYDTNNSITKDESKLLFSVSLFTNSVYNSLLYFVICYVLIITLFSAYKCTDVASLFRKSF